MKNAHQQQKHKWYAECVGQNFSVISAHTLHNADSIVATDGMRGLRDEGGGVSEWGGGGRSSIYTESGWRHKREMSPLFWSRIIITAGTSD